MPLRSMPLDGLRALYFFKNILFIFKKEGETDRQQEREGQRERERGSQANSMLSVEPDQGLDPRTLRL